MDSSDQRLGRSPPFFTGCVTRFCAVVCAFIGATCWLPPASADEIRFASRRDWQAWPLPGTVELTPQGALKPVAVRRDINAVLNAAAFGGGIRRAGFQPRRRAAGHGWRSRHRLVPTSGRSPRKLDH